MTEAWEFRPDARNFMCPSTFGSFNCLPYLWLFNLDENDWKRQKICKVMMAAVKDLEQGTGH
jgi:hypothetical protein